MARGEISFFLLCPLFKGKKIKTRSLIADGNSIALRN
jgi:hypothetical protein